MWEEWQLVISALSSAVAIIIASFAITQARATEKQAESSKIQAESARTQTAIMKQQLENTLRPWLGPSDQMGIDYKKNYEMRIEYTNYGSIPAVNIIEKALFTETMPTQKQITDLPIRFENSTCFPQQTRGFTVKVDQTLIDKVNQTKGFFYCVMEVEYNFADSKIGKFGSLLEYHQNGTAIAIKEWIL